jgi:hypothetical protein
MRQVPKHNDSTPWWARYLAGGAIIFGSLLLYGEPNVPGWIALLGIVMAAFMMYEILLGLILIGIAWAFFGLIAAIPTSVAVIIAALIIANSNQKGG